MQKLLAEDAHVVPFQPRGKRKMREWVQINLPQAEDYRAYADVFEESIRYINNLQAGSSEDCGYPPGK